MLLAVDALSDDEGASAPPAPVSLPLKRRKLQDNSAVVTRSDERRALRRVVDSNCFCKCKSKRKEHHNCFTPFQMPDTFDVLLKTRMELRKLSKSDRDLKVFNIVALRDPISEGFAVEGANLYGHHVCVRGVGKLLGVAAKKLFKYRKLARGGQSCPLDGRTRRAGPGSKPWKRPEAREQIFQYLTELWVKCSEPMPDLQMCPEQGERRQTSATPRLKARTGKRPRRLKKRSKPGQEQKSRHELRLLPPGTYSDYYRMFVAKHPLTRSSLKLFCRASWT